MGLHGATTVRWLQLHPVLANADVLLLFLFAEWYMMHTFMVWRAISPTGDLPAGSRIRRTISMRRAAAFQTCTSLVVLLQVAKRSGERADQLTS